MEAGTGNSFVSLIHQEENRHVNGWLWDCEMSNVIINNIGTVPWQDQMVQWRVKNNI